MADLRWKGHPLQEASWSPVSDTWPLGFTFSWLLVCLPFSPQSPRGHSSRLRASGDVQPPGGEAGPHPTSLTEPASLVPRPPGPSHPKVPRPLPLWPSRYRLSPSFLVSEEAQGLLGQAGPQAEGATPATIPDSR